MGTPYRQEPMYVVGDLVFFLGHSYIRDLDMIGIVVGIKYDINYRDDPLYEIYWFKQGYKAVHSGMQIELVYLCSAENDEILKINLS